MSDQQENEQDVFAKEMNPARDGLMMVAKGYWPEEKLDTFESVLTNFRDQNRKIEFGKHLYFTIGVDRPGLQTPNYERMWPVATWLLDQQQQDGRPYGKIFANRAAAGWLVELWHDGTSRDPLATAEYMDRLFQVLIKHGLQSNAHQKSQDTAVTASHRRLPPEIVAEIIGHKIMSVGYTYRKENNTFIVIHEESELGRIILAIRPDGPYFTAAMPHKIGVGERYIPRPPQDGFQLMDDGTARFGKLARMIHEEITGEIEKNYMMGLWPLPKVGDGDTAVPTSNDSSLTPKERKYRSELLKILKQYFNNEEDLKALYFDLGWTYSQFESGGIDAQARALVERCFREARQNELVDLIAQHRPNIEVPKSTE